MLNDKFVAQFAEDYMRLWRIMDEDERASLIENLFTEDAVHYIAPAGTTFSGRDAILQNIVKVNKQAIQTAGLKFVSGDVIGNGNAILYEWAAQAPNGATVRSGRDIFVLNDFNKVKALYTFTND